MPLCDIVAPLVLVLRSSKIKANLFGHILEIQNIFVLLNRSLIRGVLIEKFARLRAIYISLP